MATTRQIGLYDIVELLEPIDAAPAGAQGAVIEFLRDGTVAEIELTEPKFDDVLDSIVYARLDKLRVIKPHSESAGQR
ncbi:MAG TPA: hypothetical protein VG410_02235 [Solirubrobacteraceae bacterium]|jgi:hypothetical protein|nr:hypothetical protein [Solirubrobacteraceae bacterium]